MQCCSACSAHGFRCSSCVESQPASLPFTPACPILPTCPPPCAPGRPVNPAGAAPSSGGPPGCRSPDPSPAPPPLHRRRAGGCIQHEGVRGADFRRQRCSAACGRPAALARHRQPAARQPVSLTVGSQHWQPVERQRILPLCLCLRQLAGGRRPVGGSCRLLLGLQDRRARQPVSQSVRVVRGGGRSWRS